MQDYLRVGSDGHYYQRRDYNSNENLAKKGGFGTVRFAKDLTNDNMFAIKCNNSDSDSIIDSIDTEARLLSRLGPHENVIQMYGAVLDCEEHAFLPNRMYKLMMELAERKWGYVCTNMVDLGVGGRDRWPRVWNSLHPISI